MRRTALIRTFSLLLAAALLLPGVTPALGRQWSEDASATLMPVHGQSIFGAGLSSILALFGAAQSVTVAQGRMPPRERPLPPATPPSLPPRKAEREAKVARLELNPIGALLLRRDEPALVTALPLDTSGQPVHGLPVEWSSGNPEVAAVTADGQVRSLQAGTALLTARAGGKLAVVNVTVLAQRWEFGGPKRDSTGADEVAYAPAEEVVFTKALWSPGEVGPAKGRAVSGRVAKYASAAYFLRAPDDDPLPDPETGSLYTPSNDVGAPRGRTEPGAPVPPALVGGKETPGSANFSFGVPLVSLPGRGVDVSIALTYNSRLWHKSVVDNQTRLTYDVDSGWPAPGFQLGYGHLEAQGTQGFTLTSPDGTRHQLLKRANTTNTYDSTDGTFIQFVGNSGGGTVTSADGTRVEYGAAGTGGIRSFPWKITDQNGNYVLINYVGGVGPRIYSVQDTLNRYVRFYYQGNDLITVTVPGYAGGDARQTVRFYYEDMTVNPAGSFSVTTSPAGPSTQRVISYVYFPGTGAGYRYDYSTYGMIYRATQRRGMTVSTTGTTQTGSVTNEGQWAAETEYDYPRTPAGLSDVPAYTSRNDPWAGQTSARPVYTFSTNPSQGLTVVTALDGTRTETYSVVNAGQWDDGLVRETLVKRSDGALMARTVVTWEHDGNSRNPRPQRVEVTDEAGQTRSTHYTYTSYNNVQSASERGFDGAEMRRTETTYETRSQWTGRRLLHLPTSVRVFAGGSGTPSARTDIAYADAGGPLTRYSDIVMHDPAYNPSAAGYVPATDYRGNVAAVTRYADAANAGGAITDTMSYDIAGNALVVTADCCRQREFVYTDGYQYAYLRHMKRGDAGQLLTSATYDYNTGLLRTTTDENNQTTTIHYYPDSLRHFRTESPGGGYTQTEYGDLLYADPDEAHLHGFVKEVVGLDASHAAESWTFTDGRGAVARTMAQTGAHGTAGAYVIGDIEYDNMGRAYRASNPYYGSNHMATATNPAGLWTTGRFDALGRVDRVTLPDATAVSNVYAGSVTTFTDQANKQRRQVADALGRLVRLDEPDGGGNLGTVASPTQPTSYAYDALDNLVKVTQGAQTRFFRYDSLGRMTHERHVEQDAPHYQPDSLTGNNYWSARRVYNSHGLVEDAYDARNVNTHLTYDGLNRPQQVTHSDGTPAVTYEYDEPRHGYFNQGRMTAVVTAAAGSVPVTAQVYDYDLTGQVQRYRQAVGPITYTVTYGYNLAGQVTSETYPSGRVVTNSYDQAGRLTGVSDGERPYASGITYAAHGGLAGETWGNGAAQTLSYNSRLQVSQIKLSAGGAERQRFDYAYGNVEGATGAVDETQNTGQVGRVEGFIDGVRQWQQRLHYDRVGRLFFADEYRGDNLAARTWRVRYDYDRYGNRFQPANPTQNPEQTTGMSYIPVEGADMASSRNRFEPATGIQYDNAGNVTSDPKFRWMQYQYDANGRQKWAARLDGTGAASSVYDAGGRRVQTTAYGVTRVVVYDASGQVVSEYENGSWRRDYVYRGGVLLATDETSASCPKTVEQFVKDFYQGALARQPNTTELQQWASRLTQAQAQGQARLLQEARELGAALFLSGEYTARGRDHRQYVEDLYWGYLQRAGDQAGIDFWEDDVENHGREVVRLAFAVSTEFQDLVGRLCRTDSGGVRWVLKDHQGSARAVMNEVKIVARHDYLPFGEELWAGAGPRTTAQGYGATHDVREKYALMERDEATGLDHTPWRKYEGRSGRWTSPDPYTGSMSIADPQSFNRYSYVQNDPVNFIDPSGLNMAGPNTRYADLIGLSLAFGPGLATDIAGEFGFFGFQFGDSPVVLNYWLVGVESSYFLGSIPLDARGTIGQDTEALLGEANALARTALQNPICSGLFSEDVNPIELLNAISGLSAWGSIRTGDLGSTTLAAETKPVFNIVHDLVGGSLLGRNIGILRADVIINSNPQGPFVAGYGLGSTNRFGVSDEINRAITVIHELGHVANLLYGNDASRIFLRDGDPGQGILSSINSLRVYRACFEGFR